MWDKIANYVLKKRTPFIIGIALFSIAAGYMATKAELAYDMQKMVPTDDPDYKIYQQFKSTFGEDGNKVVIGVKTKDFYTVKFFNDYIRLNDSLSALPGVVDLLSPARVFNLSVDTNNKFVTTPLVSGPVKNQEELDSIREIFTGLRFYRGLLYNDTANVAICVVGLKDSTLNSVGRIALIQKIQTLCDNFGKAHNQEIYYSGLPFIRTEFATNVKREITLFTVIAFLVTGLLILAFFRSISTLFVSVLFIVIGVITMLAVSAILGFKLTILTGILPPVLVVVGVQNTIYLINKYHDEYRKHRNKMKALQRIISKTGVATFLINFTTAIGFGTFYFTKISILEQFGLVAFITINLIFFINMIGIPVLYSFLPVPSDKQTQHLENKNVQNFLSWVKFYAFNHKRRIYFWAIVVALFGSIYLIKLRPLAYIVDDIPHSSKVYRDLEFFQQNFNGVMPFEVIVSTNEPGYAAEAEAILDVNSFQKAMRRFSEFSKPMSIAEVISFANQTLNNGEARFYRVPNSLEMATLAGYFPDKQKNKKTLIDGLVDTSKTKLRISFQMKDVGSVRMDSVVNEVRQIADKIFTKDKYHVDITGTSAIFLKGNTYLYESLVSSTLWALLFISLTMGLLFPSVKMVIISVIPNILPLLVTAGLMGYFHVPLKPSTILVFSIAFGITVDATIHFMSTFRRYLLNNNRTLREALSDTIMEVGLSMIYTVVALFCGFLIFIFSRFEGTQSLGWLTAVTLLTGLIANLFLLPALILTFEKFLNPKEELKETVIDIPDED